MTKEKQWVVYIIKTLKNKLYTGITNDLGRRWNEHNNSEKGAKYFRSDSPEQIVYLRLQENRSIASKSEAKIKKLTRDKKLALINSDDNQIMVLKDLLPE